MENGCGVNLLVGILCAGGNCLQQNLCVQFFKTCKFCEMRIDWISTFTIFDTERSDFIQEVESMYHMWLGPNGLPISPRKQRGKLFEFCTTHFVTEAEMRYCYARLLSVGNPSGPVKYAGQPQYDSEQVVSPLFTFAMPPSSGDSSSPPSPPPPPPATKSAPMQLALTPFALAPTAVSAGARSEWSAFSRAIRQAAERAEKKRALLHPPNHPEADQTLHSVNTAEASKSASDLKSEQFKIAELEREASQLKAELHQQAMQKIAKSNRRQQSAAPKAAARTVAAELHQQAMHKIAKSNRQQQSAAPKAAARTVAATTPKTHAPAAIHKSLAEHVAAVRKITAAEPRQSVPQARAAVAGAEGALDHGVASHYWDSDARSAVASVHAATAASLARSHAATPARLDLALAKHYFQSRSPADARVRAAAAVAPANPWYEAQSNRKV